MSGRTRCAPRFARASPASTARRRSPTSCSTCIRRASSSASARSSSGSRRTCGPPRSSPRFVSPCSTRSCRPAAWRPVRGERPACASRPATSGRRAGSSSANATRGSPSRTRSGACAGSSSASRAGPPGRSRRGWARISGASGRGPRPRSSGSPARAGCCSCATIRPPMAGRRRPRASGWSSVSHRCARPSIASPPPTTRRRGSSAARRPASCRSTRWPGPRCDRRGAGRRPRSGTPSRRSNRRWRATAGSSSWSTAGRRPSSRR